MRYPGAAGFLFDSNAPGGQGGSGNAFDWSRIPADTGQAVAACWRAEPENVFDAIIATRPWGVDVSSGIELSPGIKDGDACGSFVEEVRRADCHAIIVVSATA